jgi:membrane-associated protein
VYLWQALTPLHLAASAAGGSPLGAEFWLSSLGAFGVFLVLFAETGLLIGACLPGDSLLFTAGLFCSTTATSTVSSGAVSGPHLPLPWVLLAAVAGALAGAQVGFALGRRGGRALLAGTGNRHVRRGMASAEELFSRYGYGKAIVLARFIPVVRTVINPLAGVLTLPARSFAAWQVVGGLVWSLGVTLAGYALGASVPGVEAYLPPAIAVVVCVSMIPVGLELWRARRLGQAGSRGGHRAATGHYDHRVTDHASADHPGTGETVVISGEPLR